MRRSARALAVLCLAVCLLFTLAMSVSAAATATQDGLEVTIVTDKATYAAGEEIKVTVSIKNNNTYDVDGINVETMLPKGLQVKNGDLNPKNITVEAGQTFAAVVAAEPVAAATPTTAPTTAPTAPAPTAPAPTTPPQKQDTPATGDDFQVMLWLVLVVASVCGIVLVLKCKQGTKFLCLLLCVAMVLPMIPTDVNAAEDTASITVDTKITADSKEYTISATVTYPADEEPETVVTVDLQSSKTEFSVNESGEIYFYATVTGEVASVVLYRATDNMVVLELLDDGKYAQSGDDLPGDKIFSGKMTAETAQEGVVGYYAVVNGDTTQKSNTVEIKVIAGFTDEQHQDMEEVELSIQQNIFNAAGFENMTVEKRADVAEEVLDNLVERDLVKQESVYYDEESKSYTFIYESGVLGAVVLDDWAADQNGLERNQDNSTHAFKNFENVVVYEEEKEHLGEAIVLWSFNQAWDDEDFRVPFYQEMESEFDAAGLQTTVDWNVTVEDCKKLAGYDVIMFSGHGSNQYFWVWTGPLSLELQKVSSFVLTEGVTDAKDNAYDADLKQLRVGKISCTGGTKYAILPDFFSHYYDNNELDGSFVFSEACQFYGKYGNEDYQFANALRDASAEAVVGFHNSVLAEYSRNLMREYVRNLIDGKTAGESFDKAVSIWGANDGQKKNTAYPIFSGNENAVLVEKDFLNGDFEEAATPVKWSYSGDVRVVGGLGDLTPTSKKRMAILTTGIGSLEDEYLSGTEGSVMYQTFVIPEGATKLTFSYNVISEEPSEWVGSKYNDTFQTNLLVGQDTHTVVTEEVNLAVWYPIEGIDFDGGDSTTYHTQWKTFEYDVSAFAGKTVTLQFVVCDKGDSIYDTAALIDNIYIQ